MKNKWHKWKIKASFQEMWKIRAFLLKNTEKFHKWQEFPYPSVLASDAFHRFAVDVVTLGEDEPCTEMQDADKVCHQPVRSSHCPSQSRVPSRLRYGPVQIIPAVKRYSPRVFWAASVSCSTAWRIIFSSICQQFLSALGPAYSQWPRFPACATKFELESRHAFFCHVVVAVHWPVWLKVSPGLTW